jgi:uncharacterized membrane protein
MIMKMIRSAISFVWNLFLNGLITLLPLTITFGLFSFSFRLIKGWLSPLRTINIPFLSSIPHAEIFFALGIIFLVGVIFKSIVVKSIMELFEFFLEQVPLIRPVYTGIKQLVQAFSPTNHHSFKNVVLIEFPRKGVYSIGFQTSELVDELSPNKKITYFNIFVPTTPNPTTGYFVVVQKEEIKILDLTTQEAMALIISGGIVQPHRFKCKGH